MNIDRNQMAIIEFVSCYHTSVPIFQRCHIITVLRVLGEILIRARLVSTDWGKIQRSTYNLQNMAHYALDKQFRT